MTVDFVRDRITSLRIKKGVSEYQMSYDLGHSKGYINNISSGKSQPSVVELFSICEYFGISLQDFFDEKNENPCDVQRVTERAKTLSEEDISLLLKIMDRFER